MSLSSTYTSLVLVIFLCLATGCPQLYGLFYNIKIKDVNEDQFKIEITFENYHLTTSTRKRIQKFGSVTYFSFNERFILRVQTPYLLYSREEWGAVPSTDVQHLKTPVPYVIIHHTYQPAACNSSEQCKTAMRSMQNYHNSLGWGDIGYNFCVGSEGGAYEGRGWYNRGIHAGPANNYSIGICLIGDWRVEQPPQRMLETTKSLINTGILNGVISPTYKLKGHSQIMATECPGTALLKIISTWDHFSEEQFIVNKQ